ncbi:MAG: type II toxin-antitoxin system RelE/ParE family toxin [Actinomycetota bacterium]|nr:type II toxin-antitoxin system RelE/ParE family toxin [Actinomycetota bacterium]
MPFTVEVAKPAEKALRGLERKFQAQIAARLKELASNPRPHDSIQMKGCSHFRLDSGNFRVVYDIDYPSDTVVVLDIGDRKDIYRGY